MTLEIKNGTYTIPEGFTAKIEDGKIMVEKKEKKTSDDEEIRKEINTLQDLSCIKDYLEKQKEQKPAEYNQEYREEDLQTRVAFYTYKDEPTVLYLSNLFVEEASRGAHFGTRILRGAERLAEVIGASTIRLKVKQDSPANAWYRKHGYGYMTFEGRYDWLEKNLEYMKPNKQEWSEEDEKMKQRILTHLYSFIYPNSLYAEDASECISWLKSLRPQSKPTCPHYSEGYGCDISPTKSCATCYKNPLSHWKPSEKQMKLLKEAEYALQGKDCHNRFVGFIWELKQLL